MTLSDLLNSGQPITYEGTHSLALVFSAELAATLAAAQAEYGDPLNVPNPVQLTDGRMILCADLLTEIGPNGIFASGFSHLPQELFALVDVIPMADAIALLPQPEERE